MARTVRKSIYGEEIKNINVSDILWNLLDESFDPDWTFDLRQDWVKLLKGKFEQLDFNDYGYISGSATYWSGVLTLEPFHVLGGFGDEGDILTLIKNENLQMVEKEQNEVIISFRNPTKSPLYRFFNQHKEDGCGGNVTYSVNVLLSRIEKFLEDELRNNLSSYGQWIPYEEEDIA
ncbi:hypothetical protein CVD28_01575 [Bacillus sp. M6-12]|uniref:hypothetical protein n=1 Tax=Bacillus sp. M6-12 TaxID=2054166 RepID=UPI000C75AFFD|nr:hypothetical protein [Bacillus sp. M6-12]PLS19123.1 hypothetical protein CVD28_01575 [Bacillus sp. M6-12]